MNDEATIPVEAELPAVANQDRPKSDMDLESSRGASWAMWDPETATKYSGLWVVVRHKRVIAYGSDPAVVGEEASRITGIPRSQLVVCAPASPDTWEYWK